VEFLSELLLLILRKLSVENSSTVFENSNLNKISNGFQKFKKKLTAFKSLNLKITV